LLAQLGETAGGDDDWVVAAPEPLPEEPSAFWAMPPLPEALTGALIAPPNRPLCCVGLARFRSGAAKLRRWKVWSRCTQ
jgi:hypothetical protein